MNTAAVHMHAGTGVQPHPLYSVAGAVLGTILVCGFLLWAFKHSLPRNVAPEFVELHLTTLPATLPKRVVRTVPHQVHPLRRSAVTRPVMIPESSPIKPISPSAPLDLSLPGSVFAPTAVSAFVPHAFNPYSDVARALKAPLSASTMQNGDAYRSVYGLPVVKSGGRCLVLEDIQIGPSPSAHTTVGFGISCPGKYKPSMADELKAWADKQAAKSPGGP
ncbi:MAG: hypothetical protein KGL98_11795 [Gammaproteobacteria bacterium]|nr:hypothetical protein [Gammaproteobacteria bacterium]MBU6510162.1 hypothetical protein [Gammaproteobacteria bacterium]MDE1984065.1 hypothetical protein [Gammaproteobacteria bacterium]MDE2108411.1 hypothetical protein [Gammaproteobacteria bacterium]MDE2461905.1 hypothetical protein [Gammaproteobacteria bacterium]